MKDKLNIISQVLWLVFCLFFRTEVSSQGQANYWIFSNNALIKFNGISSPSISQSNFYSSFGSATASDCDGKLLFYSNGKLIYDSTGVVVNNTPLISSSDKYDCLIVPSPANSLLYYLFYFREHANILSLNFCTVDFSNGQPVINDLNATLATNCGNKIAGIAHENGTDFWIVVHEINSDRFLTYLIDQNGLNTNPVVSSVGSVHSGLNSKEGQMRFSPKGNKLGLCVNSLNIVDLFDFNKQTGEITNPISFSSLSILYPYGIAFSQDESCIYIATDSLSRLYQVRKNTQTFPVSYDIVMLDSLYSGNFGQLQNAPDGSIYVAISISSYIGKIDHPNRIAFDCDYSRNALFLQGSQCFKGLPNFVQNYFDKTFEFSGNDVCQNSASNFTIPVIPNLTLPSTLLTDDGGVFNTTLINNYHHIYKNAGVYYPKLVVYYPCSSDTLFDTIIINEVPQFSLGNDTSICSDNFLELNAPINDAKYLWSNGETQNSILAAPGSSYGLTISKNGCSFEDSVFINSLSNPPPIVSGILEACKNLDIPATLIASDAKKYYWSNVNATAQQIQIENAGNYELEVEYNNGCMNSVNFEIIENCPFVFFAPNTFTPNGDGLNDHFCVNLYGYKECRISIFNRFGQLVFTTNNPNSCWDGNGNKNDIYRYSIKITNENNYSIVKNGTVQLFK